MHCDHTQSAGWAEAEWVLRDYEFRLSSHNEALANVQSQLELETARHSHTTDRFNLEIQRLNVCCASLASRWLVRAELTPACLPACLPARRQLEKERAVNAVQEQLTAAQVEKGTLMAEMTHLREEISTRQGRIGELEAELRQRYAVRLLQWWRDGRPSSHLRRGESGNARRAR